jgi:hypothetical protein
VVQQGSRRQIKSHQATERHRIFASEDNDNKKMLAQEWGAHFVRRRQERQVKKAREGGFTRPESFKDKMIREVKSHPDPNDPSFPQYFKNKAIKTSPVGQEMGSSNENENKGSGEAMETSPHALPQSNTPTSRSGGFCTAITNIFSPSPTKLN